MMDWRDVETPLAKLKAQARLQRLSFTACNASILNKACHGFAVLLACVALIVDC